MEIYIIKIKGSGQKKENLTNLLLELLAIILEKMQRFIFPRSLIRALRV